MLYECWRRIAGERRDELALHDLGMDRRWTFAQLNAASENESLETGPIVYPSGISSEFIVSVLRAWRSGNVACPLEEEQSCPAFERFPAGCVHLKMTSATTGASRAIAFTAAQLAADARNIVATMGLRPEWPNLGVISLAHSYGFASLVLPLLLHGIPLVLLNSTLPEAIRRTWAVVGNATVPAVPALWRAWHEAEALTSSIRLAISAGAPLPLPLEQAVFDARDVKIHNFYGATECGGIAYDRTNLPRSDASCVGSPMDNVRVHVDGDNCLVVQSDAAGETYWPEPNPDLADGRYRSNDLAELNNGMVHLRGRVTDLINVAGRKVSPDTIERALLRHPEVQDCLVFGVPSHATERTEIITACVVCRSDTAIETLKQFLLTHLPPWQVPREWLLVESLTANRRGKRSRAEWRQWFTDRKAR